MFKLGEVPVKSNYGKNKFKIHWKKFVMPACLNFTENEVFTTFTNLVNTFMKSFSIVIEYKKYLINSIKFIFYNL